MFILLILESNQTLQMPSIVLLSAPIISEVELIEFKFIVVVAQRKQKAEESLASIRLAVAII